MIKHWIKAAFYKDVSFKRKWRQSKQEFTSRVLTGACQKPIHPSTPSTSLSLKVCLLHTASRSRKSEFRPFLAWLWYHYCRVLEAVESTAACCSTMMKIKTLQPTTSTLIFHCTMDRNPLLSLKHKRPQSKNLPIAFNRWNHGTKLQNSMF